MKTTRRCIPKLQILMALALFTILFTFGSQPAYAADYGNYDHSQDAALVAKMSDLNNIQGSTFVMDITENNVPVKQVYGIFQHLLNQNPQIFYLKFGSKTCQIEQANKCVTKITVQLSDSKSGIENKVANFNAKVKQVLGSADFSRMNTVQAIVYLHNYLMENVDYCGEQADYKTAYGALIDGQATCTGYVLAFNYLLEKLGIPSGYAVSAATVHAWSVVKVGDTWYHIDVCWDDTGSTQKQSYQYLFLDQKSLLSIEPSRKDMDIQVEKYNYSEGRSNKSALGKDFWNMSDTDVVYAKGDWYYTTTDGKTTHPVMKYNSSSGKSETVVKDTGVWNAWQSKSYYSKNYTHLASDGNTLFYSTANMIYQYDPSSGKSKVYAVPSTKSGYIYKLRVKDGAVWYALGKAYNEVGKFEKAEKVDVDPGVTTLSAVKAGNKGFTASWKKQTSKVTGYELQYALKKDFSDAKTVDITDSKTNKTTVKNLENGQTYYVRVRTYNTVNDNKFYSEWTETKTVKPSKALTARAVDQLGFLIQTILNFFFRK